MKLIEKHYKSEHYIPLNKNFIEILSEKQFAMYNYIGLLYKEKENVFLSFK